MMQITPYITEDGSPTLYNEEIGEHYHSTHGAIQESLHVFIHAGLSHHIQKGDITRAIRIFEVGFGSGLNALLTWAKAEREGVNIHYFSIEKYPVPAEIIASLHYQVPMQGIDSHIALELLHAAPWDKEVAISPRFRLHKLRGDILTKELPKGMDVIYMDAFSPEVQPQVWSQQVLASLYHIALPEAILTTYCAKGIVRRDLKAVGFEVERIAGPPGKREMLRAKKIEQHPPLIQSDDK